MTYYRIMDEEKMEISYEDALSILLGTFRDNYMTRDMLKIGNCIACMYSTIRVYDDEGRTAMAGLFNLLPMDMEYDDKGNHLKKGMGDAE